MRIPDTPSFDLDEVEWLISHGLQPWEVAKRFGANAHTIEKAAARAGRTKLAGVFRRERDQERQHKEHDDEL